MKASPEPTAAPGGNGFSLWTWRPGLPGSALCFFILTIEALSPTLFSAKYVFSAKHHDLALQFIHWRKFGFDELRAGHLALWNPHIFCGAPFLGGFQSALLYPPNWLYLCLPLAVAINTGIALHVFLAGFGMCLWARQRGLHPVASLYAGVLFMFSGPFFPHIYAGHLPNLCTMVWGPYLFLAIDGWLRQRTRGWLLLGAASVALQVLAGHPQYVFYTGVAASLYCALSLPKTERPVAATLGLVVLAAGGFALSAAQLFEGLHAAGESVRNHGTDESFAAIFSLPPENLVTLAVPDFFGNLDRHDYWGRWDLWEMYVFFGVTGLVTTIYGLAKGPRYAVWSCAAIACCLFVPALGPSTPVFHWVYRYAPGFGHFRGWSKLAFPAVMLLIVVAATGFDVLLREGKPRKSVGLAVLGVGAAVWIIALAATWSARLGVPEPWHHWVRLIAATGGQYSASIQIGTANYARAAALYAGQQLMLTAATFTAMATILLAARRYPAAILALLALAVLEMLSFARSTLSRFPLDAVFDTPGTDFAADHPGDDYRISDELNHNLAMSLGVNDIWGYDPGVLRRYAEWMAVAQGHDADDASDSMPVTFVPPLAVQLLRCKYVIPLHDEIPAMAQSDPRKPPLPRLQLISKARIVTGRDEVLDAVFAPGFDPTQEIVLESPPDPAPSGKAVSGTVQLLRETSDVLEIEANLDAPAVLLITDTYSDGWRARSLLSSAHRYQVLPADYCLRAIPLDSGHHHILLEYRPTAFVLGVWVSLTSCGVFLACLIGWIRQRKSRPQQGASIAAAAPISSACPAAG